MLDLLIVLLFALFAACAVVTLMAACAVALFPSGITGRPTWSFCAVPAVWRDRIFPNGSMDARGLRRCAGVRRVRGCTKYDGCTGWASCSGCNSPVLAYLTVSLNCG